MKILLIILAVGLFFRIYNFEYLYTFDHDQDLSAWIVKDIVINHHPRLIGQLTSIDSVFVGPLYYYVLAFFFALFKMNPLAAHIPATLIGLATIASIYFVFNKFFSKTAGLLGAFLYATSMSLVFLDRWIVPTLPTVLWSVWLLYVALSILKRNFKVLPIAGLLIGLIWHIHIALLPLTLLIPTAIFLSGKKPKLAQFVLPTILIIFLSLPLIVFEARHGVMQTKGLYQALSYVREDQPIGLLRFKMVVEGASSAFSRTIFQRMQIPPIVTLVIFLLIAIFLTKQKVLDKKQSILLGLWFALNLISQQISKRDISEYYFNNLIIISILILATSLSVFVKQKGIVKYAVYLFLALFFFKNLLPLLSTKSAGDGYVEKKKVTEQIKQDVLKNGYPCIGINYIASFGKRVGFRYLMWQHGLNVVSGSTSVPVYNIVIPPASLPREIEINGIGLIIPQENSYVKSNYCQDPNNQIQPLLNYTQ